jgi:hypothetical protein
MEEEGLEPSVAMPPPTVEMLRAALRVLAEARGPHRSFAEPSTVVLSQKPGTGWYDAGLVRHVAPDGVAPADAWVADRGVFGAPASVVECFRRGADVAARAKFAVDSLLEGDGFELPVPRELGLRRGRRLALYLGSLTLRRRAPDWNATKRRRDSERRASTAAERGIEKTDELRRLKNARNRKFESISLQRRINREPDFGRPGFAAPMRSPPK